jgi:hypothetical protein
MKRSAFFVALFATVILLAPRAGAQEEIKWAPPSPDKAQRDWIQLTSGEWLWGDIELFQDLDLTFDSEELDGLTLDWGDIAAIRSARILTYSFTDDRVATGTAVMQGDIISVRTASGVEEYDRKHLLKVIEGEMSEINFWSMKASLNSTIRAGNTNQSDFNTVVKIRREATKSRVDLDYNMNYSRVDSVDTINNNRVGLGWQIIVTRGFFVSPFVGELYQDEFQNIDIRYTAGLGVGYWVVRTGKVDWNLQLAGTYRQTNYVSVEPGQPTKDETGSIVPVTVLEWEVTDDIDLDINYNSQIGVPDPKDSTHHLQAYFSMDIFGDILDLTANFTWDRIENPVTNAEGVTPERDDYRLAFGIGVDL